MGKKQSESIWYFFCYGIFFASNQKKKKKNTLQPVHKKAQTIWKKKTWEKKIEISDAKLITESQLKVNAQMKHFTAQN